jgi:hypothetical protein
MDDRSFRGSISGMSFAYCDFHRRQSVAIVEPHPHSPGPTLEPTPVAAHGE